jgi:type VI secretion system protein ImpC
MATRFSAENINFNIVGELREDHSVTDLETPFHMAVLGDFTGRTNRGIVEDVGALRKRRVYAVDRDNFPEVLSQLKVELHLPVLGENVPPLSINIGELDDFHPDRLFENLAVFDPLKEMRRALKDPATFAAVATQIDKSVSPSQLSISTKTGEPTDNLLEQILETTAGKSPGGRSRPPADLAEFVKEIVKPHAQSGPHPKQAELVAKVDAAIGELMRKILHHPEFQAIESAWRGLYFLVSRVETQENLKVFLVDISKAELATDLLAADEMTSTATYQLLIRQTSLDNNEKPWAVLGGNFVFDQTVEDAALLSRLGKLASTLGAPFITAAHPRLLGCASLSETADPDDWKSAADSATHDAWSSLRKLPEASFIGLALPRFLLRLPYGNATDPVQCFDFEETEALPSHEEYLWGNPCFACIFLLAQAFSQYGWDFRPGIIQEIDGLPLHIYKEQGEPRAKPCAEAVLSQRAAEAILEQGLMPLLTFIHQDIVRLARFQSIADPLKPLLGLWK